MTRKRQTGQLIQSGSIERFAGRGDDNRPAAGFLNNHFPILVDLSLQHEGRLDQLLRVFLNGFMRRQFHYRFIFRHILLGSGNHQSVDLQQLRTKCLDRTIF